MNIAFLTPEYPHEKVAFSAGIGTSIKNLVSALRKENIGVSVFVFNQKTDEVFVENGVKIHLIAARNYPNFGWYRYRKHLQNYLNQCIVSDSIDLIEAPDWTGITAFMNLKAPLVIRFHGTDAYFCHIENRKQKFKNFLFEKMGLLKAKAYISPSVYTAEITRYIFRLKKNAIQVIPHGLDLTQFENDQPEQFDAATILYIGTLIRKKGAIELPKIFEKVLANFPEAKLVLIGADSFDLKTQSSSTWDLMQRDLPPNVAARMDYIGKVPYQKVRDYIKAANVCVFPTFAETFGMVTVESMAMNKPVVNSNIGWSLELIEDGIDGYLVHPQNHDLYAQRIVDLLRDKDLAKQMGMAAHKTTERKFNMEQLVRDNIAFYRRTINDKNK